MSKKTALLILAAGASQRLGSPKQLLHWKDTTLLGHTIEEAIATAVDSVFVVLGANYDLIQSSIIDKSVQLIYNKHWQEGMGASIATSIPLLNDFDQVLITLCDLPLINQEHYKKLLQAHQQSSKGITATAFDDLIGVPAVFNHYYFEALAQLSGDRGARALIKMHSDDVHRVSAQTPFTDVDTMEDYKQLIDSASSL